jgi:hypothetical protein
MNFVKVCPLKKIKDYYALLLKIFMWKINVSTSIINRKLITMEVAKEQVPAFLN